MTKRPVIEGYEIEISAMPTQMASYPLNPLPQPGDPFLFFSKVTWQSRHINPIFDYFEGSSKEEVIQKWVERVKTNFDYWFNSVTDEHIEEIELTFYDEGEDAETTPNRKFVSIKREDAAVT